MLCLSLSVVFDILDTVDGVTSEKFVRSFCFCLMSSDAKSILGTIYKVSLFWIYHRGGRGVGDGGDGERSKLGPLADQYLDRDISDTLDTSNRRFQTHYFRMSVFCCCCCLFVCLLACLLVFCLFVVE